MSDSKPAAAASDCLTIAGPFDWERALMRPRLHAAADVQIARGAGGGPSRWRTALAAGGEVCTVAVRGVRDGCLQVEWDRPPPSHARRQMLSQVARIWQVDRDPSALYDRVAAEPALRPLMSRWHGIRPMLDVSPWVSLCRLVLGQQVSVASHRALVNRLLDGFGPTDPASGIRMWPEAADLAPLSVDALVRAGIPARPAATILRAARYAAEGGLDQEREQASRGLLDLNGVGPWTAAGVALFGWGDPDAAMPQDLIVRRVLSLLMAGGAPVSPARAADLLERFRPHRGEVCYLLWHHGLTAPP